MGRSLRIGLASLVVAAGFMFSAPQQAEAHRYRAYYPAYSYRPVAIYRYRPVYRYPRRAYYSPAYYPAPVYYYPASPYCY